ncbi:sin3 histone deacetylase corepressor complex component SDS3 isoform X2 [Macrosteles quadrilineatus]|uniref:sin3 histone deacetylase corepressor complex component SDS3 isoform X2 n=1 Tax=Macrosteles quadrilineatus TaxID=74068 RepID=UPI0023E19D89|nr:sin3 histone deacetylase corepressor complex component SDS3 isoform X2 [Macrosteles quadrilineatus]
MQTNNHRMSPLSNSNHANDEYDFDDDDNLSAHDSEESDEGTEEASESEIAKGAEEYTEIKEQVYRDKLANLKAQLQQLKDGTHPDYNRIVKKLEVEWKERLRLNVIWRDYLVECVERDYIIEKRAANKDLEEKKVELRHNLISEMEEKRKMVENERVTMELSGDCAETKPAMTRKLRRRPHDPAPLPDKRRGKSASHPSHLNYLAEEKEIDADLKAILRGPHRGNTSRKPVMISGSGVTMGQVPPETTSMETRIEDGKLLFERRWFHRGQPVYVEGKDMPRFPAVISAIGTEVLWVKKTSDSSKVKIYMSHLSSGKMTIKRRAA